MPVSRTTIRSFILVAVAIGCASLLLAARNGNANGNRMAGHMSPLAQQAIPQQGLNAELNDQDKAFLKAAAQINLLEMKVGDLAANQGQAKPVKDFGQRLKFDHSQLQDQLKALGDSVSGDIPGDLDKQHQVMADQLSKQKGEPFDQAFTKDMVNGHKQAIQAFEKEVQNGQNLKVMNWATEALPILRIHLHLAQQLGGQGQR